MKKNKYKIIFILSITIFVAMFLFISACAMPSVVGKSNPTNEKINIQESFPDNKSETQHGTGLYWKSINFIYALSGAKWYWTDYNLGSSDGGYVIYKITCTQDYNDAIFELQYQADIPGAKFDVYISKDGTSDSAFGNPKGSFTTIHTGWGYNWWTDDLIQLGNLSANTVYYLKIFTRKATIYSGANFEACNIFSLDNLELTNMSVPTNTTYQTTGYIKAENFVVTNNAYVTFKANTVSYSLSKRITLCSGFKVDAGSRFSAFTSGL